MAVMDQDETISFLSDPATYGAADPVERIETHISVIFLVGERAFKLKKSLKLPYVDFSTGRIRARACEEEVRLNSATAPGLYCGVRRITRSPAGQLQLGGEGALVDAVVEMVRFDQRRLFDRMAVEGHLSPDLMTETSRMIADFHQKAPVLSDQGGAANIAGVLDINEAGFATSHVFPAEDLVALSRSFRLQLDRHSARLDARASAGKIRRCHGDLHLRNICLLDGRPCLFDCIEFNPQIATIDILYDLAFLLMDLWHRGFFDLANLTMNRYLDAADEEDGFSLLPFFMAIRAAVRAHVTATQAEEPGQDCETLAAEARSYFELARELLCEEQPRLIAIGGLSGSGKSMVTDHLAPRLGAAPGARIVESDRVRKAMHGVTAETRLPAEAYRPEVSTRVYQEMARRAAQVLEQGGCVVADAVFDDPERRSLIEAASQHASGFCGIWLDADAALLQERVGQRRAGASDAGLEVLSQQLKKTHGPVGWHHVDASLPLERLVDQIMGLCAP